MVSSIRKGFLGTAIVLAWAGSGPAARAMFQPGATGNAAGAAPPAALACLDHNWIFMLDEETCKRCPDLPLTARCEHACAPCLRYFRRPAGGDGTLAPVRELAGLQLPASAWGLRPGPGPTLVVADREGGFTRIVLAAKGQSWRVARTEALLGAAQRSALGLPPGPCQAFAVAPDGSLVLAFGRSVAQVPRDLEKAGKDPVRWLLGKPPATGESKEAPGTGLSVAVGPDGQILVVDPALRLAYQVDPGTRAKQLIAQKESWPTPEFGPTEAVVAGDRLLVAGKPDPQAPGQILVGLSPRPEGGLHAVQALKASLAAGVSFTVSPDFHLILWDWRTRSLQFRFNRQAEAAARVAAQAEQRREAKARAAADAALAQLLRSMPAPAAKPRQAPAARAVQAKPGAGAGRPAPRSPEDPARATPAGLRAFAGSPRFRSRFAAWLRSQDTAAPGCGPALAGLLKRVELKPPEVTPATVPTGLGRCALDEAALERAVRWMLANADQANDPLELGGWRRHSDTAARVTFGLSESKRGGPVLEIDDLQAYARAMDAGAQGAGTVAAALRASGGRTGIHVGRDGQVRFAYGLRVALAEDLAGFRGIRPGGAQSGEHWDD